MVYVKPELGHRRVNVSTWTRVPGRAQPKKETLRVAFVLPAVALTLASLRSMREWGEVEARQRRKRVTDPNLAFETAKASGRLMLSLVDELGGVVPFSGVLKNAKDVELLGEGGAAGPMVLSLHPRCLPQSGKLLDGVPPAGVAAHDHRRCRLSLVVQVDGTVVRSEPFYVMSTGDPLGDGGLQFPLFEVGRGFVRPPAGAGPPPPPFPLPPPAPVGAGSFTAAGLLGPVADLPPAMPPVQRVSTPVHADEPSVDTASVGEDCDMDGLSDDMYGLFDGIATPVSHDDWQWPAPVLPAPLSASPPAGASGPFFPQLAGMGPLVPSFLPAFDFGLPAAPSVGGMVLPVGL